MEPLIILVFVLAAGFFFVLLTRWQRAGTPPPRDHGCGHDHGHGDSGHQHCSHDHHSHDHKDGGCCGGHQH